MRVSCVYNSPPWVVCQLTMNELATLLFVTLLMNEKLKELDQKSLLVQLISLVPGETFFLASGYLISSRI